MDDEERATLEAVKESTRTEVVRAVEEARVELAAKGTELTRLQVIRRMIGNVPLALFYYERTKVISTGDEHAALHAGAELIIELLREMEKKLQN